METIKKNNKNNKTIKTKKKTQRQYINPLKPLTFHRPILYVGGLGRGVGASCRSLN